MEAASLRSEEAANLHTQRKYVQSYLASIVDQSCPMAEERGSVLNANITWSKHQLTSMKPPPKRDEVLATAIGAHDKKAPSTGAAADKARDAFNVAKAELALALEAVEKEASDFANCKEDLHSA